MVSEDFIKKNKFNLDTVDENFSLNLFIYVSVF